jgi:hypothetical protein
VKSQTDNQFFPRAADASYFIEIFYFTNTGKICDNPLLYDTRTFPDSIFSGRDNTGARTEYKDARITSGGWCPSSYTRSSVYLLLDLQKEYHITGVLIMSDKDQTKHSRVHTLEYSRERGRRYTNSGKV